MPRELLLSPNAGLDVTVDSGHMTPLEQPEELLACLRNRLSELAREAR